VTRSTPVLALHGIQKRYGNVVALEDASLEVMPGTVHALLGENGAGKTTLVRIAFGLTTPDSGALMIEGTSRVLRSSADAIGAGIGMVHQHFSLVPAMTAAENAALGGRGRYDRDGAVRMLDAVARATGLPIDPRALVEDLSVAGQQRLEILKALARGARLLLLDEPTAVLAPAEADELLQWLRAYAARGNAAILITHKLREALAVADDVTVLQHGRTVLQRSVGDVSIDLLASAMVGAATEREPIAAATTRAAGQTIAQANDLTLCDDRRRITIRNASVALRAGEIVGVAAVEGSGQHELLLALAGRIPAHHGSLQLPALEAIAYVPEDRHRNALVLDFTLAENLALRGAGQRRGVIAWRDVAARTSACMQEFDVRAPGSGAVARTLSGGNQQKLVLAREITEASALVVAENPTRGLDVHATAQVHDRLRQASARGAAVVFHSTDLDEVLALSGRVLVAHAGGLRELPADRELVGRAMLGAE
jgi:general nucleoside transport system ATP-binding protein